jgi:hypothetical protein
VFKKVFKKQHTNRKIKGGTVIVTACHHPLLVVAV